MLTKLAAEIPACLLLLSASVESYGHAMQLKDLEGNCFSTPQKVILLPCPKNLTENKSCASADSNTSSLVKNRLRGVNFFVPKALRKLLN